MAQDLRIRWVRCTVIACLLATWLLSTVAMEPNVANVAWAAAKGKALLHSQEVQMSDMWGGQPRLLAVYLDMPARAHGHFSVQLTTHDASIQACLEDNVRWIARVEGVDYRPLDLVMAVGYQDLFLTSNFTTVATYDAMPLSLTGNEPEPPRSKVRAFVSGIRTTLNMAPFPRDPTHLRDNNAYHFASPMTVMVSKADYHTYVMPVKSSDAAFMHNTQDFPHQGVTNPTKDLDSCYFVSVVIYIYYPGGCQALSSTAPWHLPLFNVSATVAASYTPYQGCSRHPTATANNVISKLWIAIGVVGATGLLLVFAQTLWWMFLELLSAAIPFVSNDKKQAVARFLQEKVGSAAQRLRSTACARWLDARLHLSSGASLFLERQWDARQACLQTAHLLGRHLPIMTLHFLLITNSVMIFALTPDSKLVLNKEPGPPIPPLASWSWPQSIVSHVLQVLGISLGLGLAAFVSVLPHINDPGSEYAKYKAGVGTMRPRWHWWCGLGITFTALLWNFHLLQFASLWVALSVLEEPRAYIALLIVQGIALLLLWPVKAADMQLAQYDACEQYWQEVLRQEFPRGRITSALLQLRTTWREWVAALDTWVAAMQAEDEAVATPRTEAISAADAVAANTQAAEPQEHIPTPPMVVAPPSPHTIVHVTLADPGHGSKAAGVHAPSTMPGATVGAAQGSSNTLKRAHAAISRAWTFCTGGGLWKFMAKSFIKAWLPERGLEYPPILLMFLCTTLSLTPFFYEKACYFVEKLGTCAVSPALCSIPFVRDFALTWSLKEMWGMAYSILLRLKEAFQLTSVVDTLLPPPLKALKADLLGLLNAGLNVTVKGPMPLETTAESFGHGILSHDKPCLAAAFVLAIYLQLYTLVRYKYARKEHVEMRRALDNRVVVVLPDGMATQQATGAQAAAQTLTAAMTASTISFRGQPSMSNHVVVYTSSYRASQPSLMPATGPGTVSSLQAMQAPPSIRDGAASTAGHAAGRPSRGSDMDVLQSAVTASSRTETRPPPQQANTHGCIAADTGCPPAQEVPVADAHAAQAEVQGSAAAEGVTSLNVSREAGFRALLVPIFQVVMLPGALVSVGVFVQFCLGLLFTLLATLVTSDWFLGVVVPGAWLVPVLLVLVVVINGAAVRIIGRVVFKAGEIIHKSGWVAFFLVMSVASVPLSLFMVFTRAALALLTVVIVAVSLDRFLFVSNSRILAVLDPSYNALLALVRIGEDIDSWKHQEAHPLVTAT